MIFFSQCYQAIILGWTTTDALSYTLKLPNLSFNSYTAMRILFKEA